MWDRMQVLAGDDGMPLIAPAASAAELWRRIPSP
eukprot:gene2306-11771_t